MPSKFVAVQNTAPGTQILKADPNRVIFSIFLPNTQVITYISDNQDDQNVYYLQPGEIIIFQKVDGDDTTKEWWCRCSTGAGSTVLIYEEFRYK